MGIEPTSSAWKAEVIAIIRRPRNMVEGGGFEPPKAEPADLQSAPFGRSGNPPNVRRILPIKKGLSTRFNIINLNCCFDQARC